MAGKSVDQRLREMDEQIRQLQARKDLLTRQQKQQERKERTRRLIQIGGIMARLGVDTLEKAQAFQREVEHRTEAQDWLRKVTGRAQSNTTAGN